MDWFYAKDGERVGPLSESSLEQRLATGEITPETLVWCRGMEDWAPLATIRSKPLEGPPRYDAPADPRFRCHECEALFPADELIRIGGRATCAGCKAFVLQKLQEGLLGADPCKAWREANFVVTPLVSELPKRCVQCNRPVEGKTKLLQYSWSPVVSHYVGGAITLAVVLALTFSERMLGEFSIELFVLALILNGVVSWFYGRRIRVGVGLCPEHGRRRSVLGWGMAIGFFAAFSVSVLGGPGLVIGIVLAVVSAVVGFIRGHLLMPRKVSGGHVWLKGAGKPFLDSLPEWPWE